jgi:MFS family permease
MKKPEVAPVTHESPGEAQNSIRSVLTVTYSIVLLMLAASSFGRQIVSTFTSPYLVLEKGLDVGTASYLIGAASLAGIVAAPIGGLLADRVGGKRWLTAAYTASIVAFAGFLLSSNFVQLALTAFAYQFCVYSGMGASSALTARFTPAARRGMGYALFFLPSYVVGAAAPFVGGFISDAWGIWNSFIVGIAVLGVAIGILQLVPKD